MSWVKDFVSGWNQFFFARQSPLPLSIFRIAVGLFLIYYFTEIRWLLELYFDPSGVLHDPIHPEPQGPFGLSGILALAAYQGLFDAMYVFTYLAVFAFTLGLFTRVSAVLVWVLVVSWVSPIDTGSNNADNMVKTLAFLSMIAACAGHLNKRLSLDGIIARVLKRSAPEGTIPVWSARLVQIQLVLIYFFTGLQKVTSPDWYRGEAMHYVFQQVIWAPLDMSWLSQIPVLVSLLTYSALFFELVFFPVLVWPRATRIPMLILGLAFHGFIALIIKVFIFTQVMPVFYVAFLEERHLARIRGLWTRGADRSIGGEI